MIFRTTFVILVGLFMVVSEGLPRQASSKAGVPFMKAWKYPAIENPYKKQAPVVVEEVNACTILPPESLLYIGWVRGLGCDSNGNLYIWDDGYTALWKLSPSGTVLWKNKYDSVHSNAQIRGVRGAFAVSPGGQVCIGDFPSQRLILLDSSGTITSNFKIAIKPAAVTFGKDGSLFVSGFGFMYQGPYVLEYSAQGVLMRRFCERDSLSRLADWSGNSGKLATDSDGNVYYSFFYPYRIMKFSPNGDLVKTITRTVAELKPPSQVGGVMIAKTGIRGLLTLPDNTLAVQVFLDKTIWRYDIFSTNGEWLRQVSWSELPDEFWFRYWAADPRGNVYFDMSSKEWQEVVKYKIQK